MKIVLFSSICATIRRLNEKKNRLFKLITKKNLSLTQEQIAIAMENFNVRVENDQSIMESIIGPYGKTEKGGIKKSN